LDCNYLKFFSSCHTLIWINEYQEKKLLKSQQPLRKKTVKATGLILPEFQGLAVALAQRKEQIYAYDDIKEEFITVIRQCAKNKSVVNQKQFYDWLITNWNNQNWKFQGSGVFRRNWKNTNWHLLCVALINIYDCSINNRDQIVTDSYNNLENSHLVAVRKSVLT